MFGYAYFKQKLFVKYEQHGNPIRLQSKLSLKVCPFPKKFESRCAKNLCHYHTRTLYTNAPIHRLCLKPLLKKGTRPELILATWRHTTESVR